MLCLSHINNIIIWVFLNIHLPLSLIICFIQTNQEQTLVVCTWSVNNFSVVNYLD